ncbi:MAG: 3-phosphoserine/phosphohydroxythreonine transaminase [Megasphaera sp.]|jgi:phosphoserine aminotransferase|nr:3-phosphoserine/phosphohydroxythreonine transaminase [Megasphaera sp.]MCH4187122.1 3-phosphoserine/phosphohydroxythreonine transaminase [Megasphaera sp.]MCH4216942.1 3-phosphoserine/phosphohydroxythreonine transaminase [Megasphaera sp.]
MNRVYNFNAGPSAMPLDVLKQVQDEFLDFNGTGMSIVEISHRSTAYQDMHDDTIYMLRKLLQIPEQYDIIFMQGGGSLQFVMHAANFLHHSGGYINTGVWSDKAMKAASFYGKVYEVASSKEDHFTYIPKPESFHVEEGTDYVYMTSNNTIHGTEWHHFPSFDVPLFCDMSSDFLSRPVDVTNFDFIYAGIQKNVGPAGAVIGIIKDSLLQKARTKLPLMLQYKTYVEHDSTYNTPPVFNIYFVNKVCHWLDDHGGLAAMEDTNKKKAAIVYGAIDESNGFYSGHAQRDSRSRMNVTFNLPTEELEKQFITEAAGQHIIGIKGHRSLGGCRASIYNAVTSEGCQKLADFMKAFHQKH